MVYKGAVTLVDACLRLI